MGSTKLTTGITSDSMHNRNCHAYLLQLQPFIHPEIVALLPELAAVQQLEQDYNERIAYGNLYTATIAYLENQLDTLSPSQITQLDPLIYAIYVNNNHILERTEWINTIAEGTRPVKTNINKIISCELSDQGNNINALSPAQANYVLHRLINLFAPNFKPQHYTNLPSVKQFSYTQNSAHQELRFSTQAQRHNGHVRISPLFRRWLLINAQKSLPTQAIAHIYFNNLGLDRTGFFDPAGSREKDLSIELHALEQDPELKTAVITLPASHSLMAEYHYQQTDNELIYDEVFAELLLVATENKHPDGITDFRVSPAIKQLLFTNPENEVAVITQLLQNSFITMGIKAGTTLSTAQKQAVWLHFTKYELTDYIIKQLNPRSFNFSCKESIDRSIVSSLYFNLIRSFKLNNPMPKAEFERALDAAAAQVKGRGINIHRMVIWNALDAYITANYVELLADQHKSWLIYWRDMNCPHERINQLFANRMQQCISQLDAHPELRHKGMELLTALNQHMQKNVSGKRLLFEALSRTAQLLNQPCDLQFIDSYKNLADELRISNPALYVIAGLMKAFLGLLLYLPSFGYSQQLITSGLSTARSGFFSVERQQLCDDLQAFGANLMT